MQEDSFEIANKLLDQMKSLIVNSNPIKDINLFSILGMESKEVSAHSAFLYYVFKTFDFNGEKDDYNLRMLYDFLRSKKTDLPQNPHNIDIYREVAFDNGRIDFVVFFDSDAIVVELKVYAGEQDDQIKRYIEYLEQNGYNPKNVFFLTLDGRPSKTGVSFPISLNELCENVFSRIKEYRKNNPNYEVILEQYEEIVKRITGEGYMEHTDLIKSKYDIFAIDELQKAKIEKLTAVLSSFMEKLQIELNHQIEESNIILSSYQPHKLVDRLNIKNYYQPNKKSIPTLMFALNDNDKLKNKYFSLLNDDEKEEFDKKNFEILFNIEIDWNLYCGITLRQEGVDYVYLPSEKFKKEKIGGITIFNGPWLSWEYSHFNNNKIEFWEYYKNESVLHLLNDSFDFEEEHIRIIAADIIGSFNNQYDIVLKKLK